MALDKKSLKILKKIYRCPYITLAETKLLFPWHDTEEIILWLESEKYISFRIASSAPEDQGYEVFPYNDGAHLVSLRKGNVAAEDTTLLRANIALIIAILSLAISALTFIFH